MSEPKAEWKIMTNTENGTHQDIIDAAGRVLVAIRYATMDEVLVMLAAPDMLAALEATIEALGGLYGADSGESIPYSGLTPDRQAAFDKALELVGAALAKARGE